MNAYQSGALLQRIEERANAVTPEGQVIIALDPYEIGHRAVTTHLKNGKQITEDANVQLFRDATKDYLIERLNKKGFYGLAQKVIKSVEKLTPVFNIPFENKGAAQIHIVQDQGYSLSIVSPQAHTSPNDYLIKKYASGGSSEKNIKPKIIKRQRSNILCFSAFHEEGHAVNKHEIPTDNKNKADIQKARKIDNENDAFKPIIKIFHRLNDLENFADTYAALHMAKTTKSTETGRIISNMRAVAVTNPTPKDEQDTIDMLLALKYNTSPALDKANDIADEMLKNGEMATITDEEIVELANKITQKHKLKLHEFSAMANSLDNGIGCKTLRKAVDRANQADEEINKVPNPQTTSQVMAKYKTQSK